MVDVRGDVLRPPHDTTPAAVKSKLLGMGSETHVRLIDCYTALMHY